MARPSRLGETCNSGTQRASRLGETSSPGRDRPSPKNQILRLDEDASSAHQVLLRGLAWASHPRLSETACRSKQESFA
ncbi:hypothetical protein DEO72_LG10g431 [Vigna unguiculata]|uniref:Uncharacterized protein n=1 Tax=Vigna unguiculata TaxID=3917 RepID=A0A4D6N8I4_VIGUN|nr:hypothetical protein DEO72_LG10g431 [Vigna unguiculata]